MLGENSGVRLTGKPLASLIPLSARGGCLARENSFPPKQSGPTRSYNSYEAQSPTLRRRRAVAEKSGKDFSAGPTSEARLLVRFQPSFLHLAKLLLLPQFFASFGMLPFSSLTLTDRRAERSPKGEIGPRKARRSLLFKGDCLIAIVRQ